MIAYKWVIEKENKYYSLINFKIDRYIDTQLEDYKLHKIYDNPVNLAPNKYTKTLETFGYHFWKHQDKHTLQSWNRFLKTHNQPTINGLLKCKLLKIKGIQEHYQGKGTRIVAESFMPLKFRRLEEII